jgi:hypothetical protein
MFRKENELAVNYENPAIIYSVETKAVEFVRRSWATEKGDLKMQPNATMLLKTNVEKYWSSAMPRC